MITAEVRRLAADLVADAVESAGRVAPAEVAAFRRRHLMKMRRTYHRVRRAHPEWCERHVLKELKRRHPTGFAEMRRIEQAARDQRWLGDRSRSAPWIEAAGLDYDALVDRLRARGIINGRTHGSTSH